MFRSLSSLFRSHWLRLIGMSMIFSIVILIILLVEQIIVNIDSQVSNETKPIIGADMTISNSSGFNETTFQGINTIIEEQGGKALRKIEFYTTLAGASEPKLVKVQGIQDGYPRYGDIIIKSTDGSSQRNSKEKPLQNGVWIDQQTYNLIGGTNTIIVGDLTLDVLGIITEKATVGFSFLDEGRTIMMPFALASETKLTDFGSRLEHEILIKSPRDEQISAIQDTIKKKYGDTFRIRLAADSVAQLGGIVQQLDQYTSMVLIITLVLSLIVMATAIMTMTIKIKTSIAIMRIVGLTRPQAATILIVLFGSLFLCGMIVGGLAGYGLFINISTLFPIAKDFIWYPSQMSAVFVLAIVSFIVACWKAIRYLSMTPPLKLLQQKGDNSTKGGYIGASILCIGARIILSILNKNPLFSAIAILISSGILRAGYWLLMMGFRGIFKLSTPLRSSSFGWFDAIRQTIIPGNQTGLLVGGLSGALLAFCIIITLSLSFITRLRISAIDQPNLFVLNVRGEDIPKIEDIDPQARLYDSILGRISAINSISLKDHLATRNEEGGEFTREFNMTSISLENSPIISGNPLASGGVSLDQDFAKRLGVSIGDSLTILLQGRVFNLTITSLRKSIRSGSEPFFYIQLDTTQFAQAPRSRFRVTKKNDIGAFTQQSLNTIGKHLSFVDISAIIALVTDIGNKIIAIIVVCMSIIILLILLVSIASNEASALVAQQTYWLYNIIGMTKKQLYQISLRIGTIYVGAILLILAITVPTILWLIFRQASIITWSYASLLPLIGGIVITLGVMIISYTAFHRSIIKKSKITYGM